MAPEEEREAPPALPPPASVEPDHVEFYQRADAELAALDAWGQAEAQKVSLTWGPTPPEREGQR